MKCIIPYQNIKTFSKAITALSRIGEELHLEFAPDRLLLRTINTPQSAYGSFVFHPEFFTEYRTDGASHGRRSKDNTTNRLRVLMRTLLHVFKAAHTGDPRQVESCGIEVDLVYNRVRFSFSRKSRVVHCHSVEMMDAEVFKVPYSRKRTRNHAVAPAKLLSDTVDNFPMTIGEITFSFEKEKFMVSNYMGDTPDPKQSAQMQVRMDIDEFENYAIQDETSITFTLKELKGVVQFISNVTYQSDVHGTTGLPLSIHFTGPGTPVLFHVEVPYQYEANFAMATMDAAPNTPIGSQDGTQAQQPHYASVMQSNATQVPTTPNIPASGASQHVPSHSSPATPGVRIPVPAQRLESASSVRLQQVNGNHPLHSQGGMAQPSGTGQAAQEPVGALVLGASQEVPVVNPQDGPTSRRAAIMLRYIPPPVQDKRNSQLVVHRVLADETDSEGDDDGNMSSD